MAPVRPADWPAPAAELPCGPESPSTGSAQRRDPSRSGPRRQPECRRRRPSNTRRHTAATPRARPSPARSRPEPLVDRLSSQTALLAERHPLLGEDELDDAFGEHPGDPLELTASFPDALEPLHA